MELLRLEHVISNYGNICALKGLSFHVNQGEIVTLIGANGAGKTTTMKTITHLKEMNGGKIIFQGEDISKWGEKKRVQKGIVLSPEGRQIFHDFSVYDNLMMGGYLQTKSVNAKTLSMVYQLFPRLEERKDQAGGTLSGGEQQMLAVARALMSKPRLLLLDEPSMGLAPIIVKEIFELIKRIRELGTTILLVEQNAMSALKISDRAYVLENGKIVLSGNASDLLNSAEVKSAYLGI